MNSPVTTDLAIHRTSFKAWLVWGLTAAFYFYEYFLQVSPGVMVPDLMRSFKVDATHLGNLAAFYFYTYAPMQILVGLLLDRYGPRRLITFATGVCALGSLLFGTAHVLGIAEIGRSLIGLGSAFAAVGCLKIAANWFPMERFALLTGLMVMVGMTGAAFGEIPLAVLVDNIGWRASMMILTGVGAMLTIAIWQVVRDRPPEIKETERHELHTTTIREMLNGLLQIIRSKQSWLVATYGGLMFAPTSTFGSLWGVPFLMEAAHISRPRAAGLVTFVFIGWMVGSPVGGWVSDRIRLRRPPMIAGSLGALLSILGVIYIPDLSPNILAVLLFSFGFFSGGFLPAFSIVKEINPPRNSATALGFINFLNMIGGLVALPVVGYFLDMRWSGKIVDGVHMYSIANYHFALVCLPIMIALSLGILPFIKETYCKPSY